MTVAYFGLAGFASITAIISSPFAFIFPLPAHTYTNLDGFGFVTKAPSTAIARATAIVLPKKRLLVMAILGKEGVAYSTASLALLHGDGDFALWLRISLRISEGCPRPLPSS